MRLHYYPQMVILFVLAGMMVNAERYEPVITGPVSRVTFLTGESVPNALLRKTVRIRRNEPYTPDLEQTNLEKLNQLDIFNELCVTATYNGSSVDLTFSCEPQPRVRSLTVLEEKDGKIRRKPDKVVEEFFPGQESSIFKPNSWFKEIQALRERYYQQGYHGMSLDLTTQTDRVNRIIDQKVVIHTGTRTFIDSIIVSGAASFTPEEISLLLHCHPRNDWLFRKGEYDPRRFKDDAEAVRQFYFKHGFLDAQVTVTNVETRRAEYVDIKVNITEGPQYTLGEITWKQRVIPTNDFTEVKKALELETGMVYYASLPDDIRAYVQAFCRDRLQVNPEVQIVTLLNPESSPLSPVVDITITIRRLKEEGAYEHKLPARFYNPLIFGNGGRKEVRW